MRNLLPCLAALVLATTTLTTQIASACGGGYEAMIKRAPRIMLVSSHTSYSSTEAGTSLSSTTRSFALFAKLGAATEGADWDMVAPRSYDHTRVRPLGKTAARTLTLVGPSGSRLVKVASTVELASAFFGGHTSHEAAELPVRAGDDFEIAIEGAASNVKWHAMHFIYTYTVKLLGTSLSVTSRNVDGEPRVTLYSGKRELGTYRGHAVGAVDIDGSRYVVISDDSRASLVKVPMT